MLTLKKLIKIGKSSSDTQSKMNLDLIRFPVTDLMRSKVKGSKS